MTRTARFLLWMLIASSCGAATTETPVALRIAIGRDEVRSFDFVDRPLRFLTCAGEVSIPLREISSIRKSTDGSQYTVQTLREDQWLAVPVEVTLRYYYLNAVKTVDLARLPFSLLERAAPAGADWKPDGRPELILKDGSHAHLDGGELSFRTRNELGAWDLPVGALRVIKIDAAESGRPIKAIAKFPSGFIEATAIEASRNYFAARDTYGNALKVRFSDVKGLLGRKGVDDSLKDSGEEPQSMVTASRKDFRVAWANGQQEVRSAPCVVWEVRGELGDVSLPSHTLQSVHTAGAEHPQGLTVFTTLYGERFVGRAQPAELRWPAAGSTPLSPPLRLAEVQDILYDGPVLEPPPDWMGWLLASGDAFLARVEQSAAPLFTRTAGAGAEQIGLHAVQTGVRLESGLFRITLRNQSSGEYRPIARDVSVILLSNGLRYRLAWSRVQTLAVDSATFLKTPLPTAALRAEPQGPTRLAGQALSSLFAGLRRPASPSPVRASPAAAATPGPDKALAPRPAPPPTPAPARSAPPPRLRAPQPVRTSFGSVALERSDLTAVHIAEEAGNACFETVCGDVFVSESLSQREVASLAAWGSMRTADTVTVSFDNPPRPAPDGWLAWQMDSGDIFHARPVAAALAIRLRSDGKTRSDLAVSSLKAIRPAEGDGFVFTTREGDVEGLPVERLLAVVLLCNGATSSLPWRAVAAVAAGTAQALPPPTALRPGWPPALAGLVPVPGATFRLGRTTGPGMDDEVPSCEVRIPSFLMDACEVTRAQFAAFARDAGYRTAAEEQPLGPTWRNPGFEQRDDEPVCCVSWFDAVEYCNWRSRQAGLKPCYEKGPRADEILCRRDRSGYRLPTEAEWEFAARQGGQDLLYPWGAETNAAVLVTLANFRQPAGAVASQWPWTCPVKAYAPSPLGLYGLAGNVWEWCQDWYSPQAYRVMQARQPSDPCLDIVQQDASARRVMRGGSFHNELDLLRCASRAHGVPTALSNRVGFRCVRRTPNR